MSVSNTELGAIMQQHLELEFRTPDGYYGYDDVQQLWKDFIDYWNEDISQPWWCDRIGIKMMDAKRLTEEYLQYHL